MSIYFPPDQFCVSPETETSMNEIQFSAEAARLSALSGYEILDTAPESEYDDLARLAALVCEAPSAYVSLVDENRLWFKSRFGAHERETPRADSFCALAIEDPDDVFVVEDALADPRFEKNLRVVDAPFIRFYAGAPLVTKEGFALGTLCVIDRRPHRLDAAQLYTLKMLARQIVSLLELRRALREIELKTARDSALESALIKSGFLTHVSHEIRTPVNDVIGMTELLLKTPLDRAQHECAETIRQSGEELLTIINNTLDLAKIEAGKLRFEPVDFDLRELVESTVELFATRAYRKNLEIASLIEADVPAAVRGDAGRLRQVLTNLISNAVKYTEAGEIAVGVSVENQDDETAALRFTVVDTGIGIALKNIKHLFQPFVRVDDSITRLVGGMGLGLAISKQIVEMMNGEITVKSTPQKGAEFSFTARFAVAAQRRQSAQHAAAPPTLKSGKILVADAHALIRRTLVDYLRHWNLEAHTAESGGETLQRLVAAAARGTPFDAAVIDMNLTDWEGFALARRIKSDDVLNGTKIILTTAHGQLGDAAQAQSIGISGYLTKPIRGSQIFDSLSTVFKDADFPAASATFVTHQTLRTVVATEKQPRDLEIKNRSGLKILVVEDMETNRRVIRRQLEVLDISADTATDGVDALEKIAAQDYDIVFMDCQMPHLDGYQTTRRIRRRESENAVAKPVVVIALTAHTLAGEREKCLAAGMNDYLSKPVKMGDLEAMITFWGKFSETATEKNPEFTDDPAAPPHPSEPSDAAGSPHFCGDEIIQLFAAETLRHRAEMDQAATCGDFQRLAKHAHAVRGNALAVGFESLAETMKIIESRAKEVEAATVLYLLEEFDAEFSRLLKK